MADSKLAYSVHVPDQDGTLQVFGPDSEEIPAWARKAITNPAAWVGGGIPVDVDDEPYKGMLKADLEAEIGRRNEGRDAGALIVVEGSGKVADLVAALEADDNARV